MSVVEYPLGVASLGWKYDGTLLNPTTYSKWQRQVSNPNHDLACYFAPDDPTMIETYLRPDDAPFLSQGARSQIIRGYDAPILDGHWISGWCWTRADYKPQSSRTWPNWNAFGFCNHDGGYTGVDGKYHSAPQAPMGMGVWTYDPIHGTLLNPPRIGVTYAGGDDWVNWWQNRKTFIHPEPFVPGKIYFWDCWCKDGESEMWMDGINWIPRIQVPTMWKKPKGVPNYVDAVDPGVKMEVFAVQENYRPSNVALAAQKDIQVTWDQVMRFGRIRIGATREETTFFAAPTPTPTPTPTPIPLSSIKIISPLTGTKQIPIKATGKVVWEAVPNSQPERVEFRIDAQLGGHHLDNLWTEHAAPYRFNGDTGFLDTLTLPNGIHRLGVRAYKSDGSYVSAVGWINVQN